MGPIQVQSQGCPHPPPLPLLYETGVKLPYIERIEPPEPIGDCECNTCQEQCVEEAARPAVRMKFWWWRRWRRLVESLDLVLAEVFERRRSVAGLYQLNTSGGIPRNRDCNADGIEHECPLIALRNARRAEDFDRASDMFQFHRRDE